jgi:hypothetical protein
VRARIEPGPLGDGSTRFVPLPEVVPAPAPGPGLATIPAGPHRDAAGRPELESILTTSVDALMALARRAAAARPSHYALADDCLRAVLARRPDHAEARRLLGFVPREGGWATPVAGRKLRAGQVLHPDFGWVDADWVPHLERGELPAPTTRRSRSTRWLPADEADAQHGTWDRRWRIFTDHFEIHTDVPLAEGVRFGRQVEAFHDLFFALLADVVGEGLPLAQRFHNPKLVGERSSKPHLVYYFATKDEYVEFLLPGQGPGIAKSLGIYIPAPSGKEKRVPAYFFRDVGGPLDMTATLYHEVSHQLLFESGVTESFRRNDGNYWVFEGLGTYFETLVPGSDGALRIGGLIGPRIREAQVRILDHHEFVPIAQLVLMGPNKFNREEVVRLHYAESMALTVFLMQAHQGRYREAFLDYVKDAYRGRLRRDSGRALDDRLGATYAGLDAEFLEYLKPGPTAEPSGR